MDTLVTQIAEAFKGRYGLKITDGADRCSSNGCRETGPKGTPKCVETKRRMPPS